MRTKRTHVFYDTDSFINLLAGTGFAF